MKTATRGSGRHGHASDGSNGGALAQPILEQRGREIQVFGTVTRMPIDLSEKVCQESAAELNEILADSLAIRDLYKKCHWQVSGPTFYSLHLLFDKHYAEQAELIDMLAERVQILGGISIAMAHDVAETTRLPRPPKGREEPPAQITRLLDGHRLILEAARKAARAATKRGDDGTNDLLVSDVIRTNEMQTWFLAEHLVKVPLVEGE